MWFGLLSNLLIVGWEVIFLFGVVLVGVIIILGGDVDRLG